MKVLEKVIQSNLQPQRQDVVWIDTSNPTNPMVKIYNNGEWKLASESGVPSDVVRGVGIKHIINIDKDDFDALVDKDPETIYIVKDDPTRGHTYEILTIDTNEYLAIADRNIGAESITDGGYYFQWAGTVGHNKDEEYSYCLNTSPYYDTDPEVGNYIKYTDGDGKTHLELMDDAAHVLWGGKWTTISYNDMNTLLIDFGFYGEVWYGVPGFCLNTDTSTLFFPRSIIKGDDLSYDYTHSGIWTSGLVDDNFDSAFSLKFSIERDGDGWFFDECIIEDTKRYYGCNIRPVIKVNDLSELEPTYEIYIGRIKASSSAEPQPQQGGMTVIRHMIGDSNITANPNEFHIIPSCNSLTLSLNDSSNPDTINYYIVMFTFGGTNSNPNLMPLSVPDTVKWANGIIPDITLGTYQLSILEGCATLTKFELA